MGFALRYRNVILDTILTGPLWLSLHDGDGREVEGRGYRRREVRFPDAVDGAVENANLVDFTDMPGLRVTGVGLWTRAHGGEPVWDGRLVAAKVVNEGDTFRMPKGGFRVTVKE